MDPHHDVAHPAEGAAGNGEPTLWDIGSQPSGESRWMKVLAQRAQRMRRGRRKGDGGDHARETQSSIPPIPAYPPDPLLMDAAPAARQGEATLRPLRILRALLPKHFL